MSTERDAALPERSPVVLPRRAEIEGRDGLFSYLAWMPRKRNKMEPTSDGRPILHFAHANGFNAQTYQRLLAPLSESLRVFAFDARGHGLTKAPADPKRLKDWDDYREDLICFLDQLVEAEQLDGPPDPRSGELREARFILAGHSLGGSTSLLVAAARPDLVRALVLVEPVILPYAYHWWVALTAPLRLRGRTRQLVEGAARRRRVFPSREEMIATYRNRGAFRTWPEEMIADYVAGGTRPRADGQVELACDPAWEAATFRAQAPFIWRRIARLRCPITLIRGGQNSTCPEAVARRLARMHPSARLVYVPEASHFLPMERPEVVQNEILHIVQRSAALE